MCTSFGFPVKTNVFFSDRNDERGVLNGSAVTKYSLNGMMEIYNQLGCLCHFNLNQPDLKKIESCIKYKKLKIAV